jgi:hypothetical protein
MPGCRDRCCVRYATGLWRWQGRTLLGTGVVTVPASSSLDLGRFNIVTPASISLAGGYPVRLGALGEGGGAIITFLVLVGATTANALFLQIEEASELLPLGDTAGFYINSQVHATYTHYAIGEVVGARLYNDYGSDQTCNVQAWLRTP